MAKSSLAVDKIFEDRLTQFQKTVANDAALRRQGLSAWHKTSVDSDDEEKIVDGFDHEEIKEAFSRNGTSKAYLKSVDHTDPGTNIEGKVAKIQGDVLSGLERDTRMRHRSVHRLMAHGLAKQTSHGLAAGAITGTMLQTVKNLIQLTENTEAPVRTAPEELPKQERLNG